VPGLGDANGATSVDCSASSRYAFLWPNAWLTILSPRPRGRCYAPSSRPFSPSPRQELRDVSESRVTRNICFQQNAGKVLRFFRTAKSEMILYRELSYNNAACQKAADFLQECVARGFLVRVDRPVSSKAKIFDFSDFSDDLTGYATPVGCEIELTLRCRRKCSYCAYDSSPTVPIDNYLTFEQWLAVLTTLHEAGVFFIRITGGDPLVHPRIIEIVEFASTLGFQITIGSDLTAVDLDTLWRLSAIRNLVALKTTLDGPTALIADTLRGSGSFANVARAVDLIAKRSMTLPLAVGTIVSTLNYDSIFDTAALINSWGIRKYSISALYDAGRSLALKGFIPSPEHFF
jgi:sulfatase maturation enzyme AslB (radical SAM superfamily)